MSIQHLKRPILAACLFGLAGCVAAPAPLPPQPPGTVAYGSQCFAGFYVCPLGAAQPVGSPCSCPGLGAPSYGTVR